LCQRDPRRQLQLSGRLASHRQMDSFAEQRHNLARLMENALGDLLTHGAPCGPGAVPDNLLAAMRHGTLDGGKRLRPLLVMQSAGVFGLSQDQALATALAVELVHCYSLIHDDLPAMDDDDLRRGKPSVHKKFSEASAILAGDALLAHAFVLLAEPSCHPDANIRTKLVLELASASGGGGMVGGQARDLEGEKTGFSHDDISKMQAMKTGALIRASVRMGAILGNPGKLQLEALTIYGEQAGLAFQLADDILDLTASTEQMGKATQKDAARAKPTLVSRIGLDAAERHLGDTIHHAISALAMFGPEANGLRATARFFVERVS
jgi:farnesyl diphosphate synthase